ncbi:MAG: hypothetical protein GY795_49160 [Desulfobacterales bacterium]|nr:hypothetical protein [Desulfobacterales bacterium]
MNKNNRSFSEIVDIIFSKKIGLPYEEWKNEVKPYTDIIISEVEEIVKDNIPYLKANQYTPKSNSECYDRIMWKNSLLDKLALPRKEYHLIFQIGTPFYENIKMVMWGLRWWGSRNDSERVQKAFDVIKGNYKIRHGKDDFGTFAHLICEENEYTKFKSMTDYKQKIVEDFSNILNRIENI